MVLGAKSIGDPLLISVVLGTNFIDCISTQIPCAIRGEIHRESKVFLAQKFIRGR